MMLPDDLPLAIGASCIWLRESFDRPSRNSGTRARIGNSLPFIPSRVAMSWPKFRPPSRHGPVTGTPASGTNQLDARAVAEKQRPGPPKRSGPRGAYAEVRTAGTGERGNESATSIVPQPLARSYPGVAS